MKCNRGKEYLFKSKRKESKYPPPINTQSDSEWIFTKLHILPQITNSFFKMFFKFIYVKYFDGHLLTIHHSAAKIK